MRNVVMMLLLCLVQAALLTATASAQAAPRAVTVGVVSDGPQPEHRLRDLIEQELATVVGSDTRITYKEFEGDWTMAGARAQLQSALTDSKVGLVLVTGYLTGNAVLETPLRKPVVFAQVLRSGDLVDLEPDQDRSPIDNLSFIYVQSSMVDDVDAFKEILPFSKGIAILGSELREIDVTDQLRLAKDETNTDVTVHYISPESAPLPTAIDSATVIFMAPTPRLTSQQRRQFIDTATAAGIPVFGVDQGSDVELGVLATRRPESDPLVARRVALNISELLRGTATSQLPVFLNLPSRVVVNGATAAALGFKPSLETLAFAEFVHIAALEEQDAMLDMPHAFDVAQQHNVRLDIVTQTVETSRRDMQLKRSPILPQITLDGGYRNQAVPGIPELPTDVIQAGFQASQMIYDDRVVADYRSSKRQLEANRFDREAERLDLLKETGDAYLILGLAQTLYRVQVDNLRLTEQNLELARLRLDAGYSGPDEVYRWESTVAQQKGSVFRSISSIETERITLNQVMGIDQSTRWRTQPQTVRPDSFPFLHEDIVLDIYDPVELEAWRRFSIRYALANAPELMAFDKSIEAQSLLVSERKRAWVLPRFFVAFNYNYQIKRRPELIGVPNDQRLFQVVAEYPLFVGGKRSYEMTRNQSLLYTLEKERTLIEQLVERRTRSSLRHLENNYPTIRLSRVSAENAEKNLKIVRDQYTQGLVNVTDLLSAQNDAFIADQAVAATTYAFMGDLLAYQRAISWFQADKTRDEVLELVTQLQQALGRQ